MYLFILTIQHHDSKTCYMRNIIASDLASAIGFVNGEDNRIKRDRADFLVAAIQQSEIHGLTLMNATDPRERITLWNVPDDTFAAHDAAVVAGTRG